MGSVRNLEAAIFGRLRLRPPSGLLGRLAVWLAVITAVLTLGRLLPGVANAVFFLASLFSALALLCVLAPLLWRYTVGRFLWRVSNRLIVTYLLMGFAPVVLFVLLAFITSYIILGQFAVLVASTELDRSLQQLAAENRAHTGRLAHAIPLPGSSAPVHIPDRTEFEITSHNSNSDNAQVEAFLDGVSVKYPLRTALPPGRETAVPYVPAWAPDHFNGVVFDQGHLYLRAIDSESRDNHKVTAISSIPLVTSGVDKLAERLGRLTIVPDVTFDAAGSDSKTGPLSRDAAEEHAEAIRSDTVTGGKLPPSRHFYDLPVNFYAPLATTDWRTGASRGSGLHVVSRPTILYERLFITSLEVGVYVQYLFAGLAFFFALLELAAFLMAMRLNQTITRSISDLYGATLAIDRGQFAHRIAVTRRDQLAALSQSFNTMTASLERLLEEQREKERLLGELEIAQEVQASLFPSGHVSLPSLEVHGVCQPARTVSGDYYDFLVAGTTELSLALGDISGKGISAALLMATLHSAVRAYRFAGDDFRSAAAEDSAAAASARARQEGAAAAAASLGGVALETDAAVTGVSLPMLGASFAEPGQILGLLNRHLYRSTQPAKYATLFLAHYNGANAQLTYSTGGQLPPLLLRHDDTVVRLDCGGTVIGLMDHMHYEQGRETMLPGDILIAYSDGVTEPENEFGDFGEDRLVELVRRHRKLPLEQIADQVMQSLRSWIGTQEQPDDITLVLARQR